LAMAYTWRHPAPLAAGRKGCFVKQGHDSGWETSMVEKVTDKKLYHVTVGALYKTALTIGQVLHV